MFKNGAPVLANLNGGELVVGQDQALNPEVDFTELGNGIPDLELGWTNQVTLVSGQ